MKPELLEQAWEAGSGVTTRAPLDRPLSRAGLYLALLLAVPVTLAGTPAHVVPLKQWRAGWRPA